MKPRPVRARESEGYPDRREFLAALAGGAIALALTRSSSAGPSENSDDAIEKQIADLAARLGDKDFKKRDEATKQLIEIGKGAGEDKAADAIAKKLVIAEMESLKKHKDPEIAQRAKNVILALSPKPPPPAHPPALRGRIRMPGKIIQR